MSLLTAFTHVVLGLSTPLTFYNHLHTSPFPVILIFPQHMTHPSQPTSPHTSSISLIPGLFLSSALVFLSLSDTPHTSNHSHFCFTESSYLLSICCPGFTSIQHCTSYTCCINPAFQSQWYLGSYLWVAPASPKPG